MAVLNAFADYSRVTDNPEVIHSDENARCVDLLPAGMSLQSGQPGLARKTALCGNIGNLMLVRTSRRYREAGIRIAVGAGRAALFRLVLCEARVPDWKTIPDPRPRPAIHC